MSEIERYNGLTTADKGALLGAKARGAEWVARDEDGQICEYQYKPVKFISKIWKQGWWSRYGVPHSLMFDGEVLPFVKWSDTEPVNIDLALAQIAEMESAEKPLTWNERINQMTVEEKAKALLVRTSPYMVYEYYALDGKRFIDRDDAIEHNMNLLNSPYTEGETK